MHNIPMAPAGVGGGIPTRWIFSETGNIFSATGIRTGVYFKVNLKSLENVNFNLKMAENCFKSGIIPEDDYIEFKERVRTAADLALGGIHESAGKVETVYRDGVPVKVKRRGRFAISTDAQKRAAENARQFAHTDEAEKKRRKSLNARKDGKILGEV